MLPALNECSIEDEVCCSSTYDIANFVLNTVWDGLVNCIPEVWCKGMYRYVTLGNGDDGIADALTVAFLGATPSPGSSDGVGQSVQVNLMRGNFDVRLRESGWPIARDDGGVLNAPDPALQHAVARHAYSHGEKMFRILRTFVADRTLWITNHNRPAYIKLADPRVIPPLGGVIGFAMTLTCDLPWFGNQ